MQLKRRDKMEGKKLFRELEKKLAEKYGYGTAELLTIYTFKFLGEGFFYDKAVRKAYNKIIKEKEKK